MFCQNRRDQCSIALRRTWSLARLRWFAIAQKNLIPSIPAPHSESMYQLTTESMSSKSLSIDAASGKGLRGDALNGT